MREITRQHLDACSMGMQTVQEIVSDLEKDNAIFGKYLEDAANGGQRTVLLEERQLATSFKACTRAKSAARARAIDVNLHPATLNEVNDMCAEFQASSPKKCSHKVREKRVTKSVHVSESLLTPLSGHSQSVFKLSKPSQSPLFQARPLPEKIYGVSCTRSPPKYLQEQDVARRTVDWYHQKQKARDEAREQRKRAALEALKPAPNLEQSFQSWHNAKQEAILNAQTQAAEEIRRQHLVSTRKALKLAKQAKALKSLQAETLRLKKEARIHAVKSQPRHDAPITRTTAAFRYKAKVQEETDNQPKEYKEPQEQKLEEEDPFSALAPFRLDPRVLAIAGDDFGDDQRPQKSAQSTFSDRVKKYQVETIKKKRQHFSPEIKNSSPDSCSSRRSPTSNQVESLSSPIEKQISSFFDELSSKERGRKQVRDARLFQPTSMRRDTLEQGIVLLKGCTVKPPHSELVICVLFDRHRFSEEQAMEWWDLRGQEFVVYNREVQHILVLLD